MIFCSVNEAGEVAWKLILCGRKTVTRRLKSVAVGKILAVQPGRGKKAVGHIKVISCIPHKEWFQNAIDDQSTYFFNQRLMKETELEGFKDWRTIENFFFNKKINIHDTFRIEFVKVD
jgi:hypothetical protein